MSLDKAIQHGKEKRKQFRGAKSMDSSCRCHGSCPHCKCSRLHKINRQEPLPTDPTEMEPVGEGITINRMLEEIYLKMTSKLQVEMEMGIAGSKTWHEGQQMKGHLRGAGKLGYEADMAGNHAQYDKHTSDDAKTAAHLAAHKAHKAAQKAYSALHDRIRANAMNAEKDGDDDGAYIFHKFADDAHRNVEDHRKEADTHGAAAMQGKQPVKEWAYRPSNELQEAGNYKGKGNNPELRPMAKSESPTTYMDRHSKTATKMSKMAFSNNEKKAHIAAQKGQHLAYQAAQSVYLSAKDNGDSELQKQSQERMDKHLRMLKKHKDAVGDTGYYEG